jgi:hypothetical protein
MTGRPADRLSPADHSRLVAGALEPPTAAAARQELDTVLGAFGGLSDAHHEILVLRELEGMSYADIGERMGMSRAGVESTLFRARKRLGEEYDELASGARCVRVQGIIAADGNDKLGARDARRLARHVAHCQPCRRLALQAGLEVPARRGLGGRIAAWLPLPGFLRFGGWGTQRVAELLEPGWGKLAAGAAALLLAAAGAEQVVTHGGGDRPVRAEAATSSAAERGANGGDTLAAAAAGAPVVRDARAREAVDGQRHGARAGGDKRGGLRRGGGNAGADAPSRGDAPGREAPGSGGGTAASRGSGEGGRTDAVKPVRDAVKPVRDTVDRVDDTADNAVQNTSQTVQNATQNTTNTAQNLVDNVQKTVNEPQNLVPNVVDTVDQTVNDAGGAVDGAVNDVGGTVEDAVDDAGGTVGGLLEP